MRTRKGEATMKDWWKKASPEQNKIKCFKPAGSERIKTTPFFENGCEPLSLISLRFAKNNQINRAAVHDLGLAAGNLVVDATARGLSVHQMIGIVIVPDKAREVYQISEPSEAWTAMSFGYRADPTKLPEALKERAMAARQRKSLGKFVFTGRRGQPSPLVLKRDS